MLFLRIVSTQACWAQQRQSLQSQNHSPLVTEKQRPFATVLRDGTQPPRLMMPQVDFLLAVSFQRLAASVLTPTAGSAVREIHHSVPGIPAAPTQNSSVPAAFSFGKKNERALSWLDPSLSMRNPGCNPDGPCPTSLSLCRDLSSCTCFVNWLRGLLPVEHSAPPRMDMLVVALWYFPIHTQKTFHVR